MTFHIDFDDESVRNRLDEGAERRLYGAMRNFWHPVMYSQDLSDTPVGVILLGEQLVLARMEGQVRCFRDLCAHRGAALSLGWNEGKPTAVLLPRVDLWARWRLHFDPGPIWSQDPAPSPDRPVPCPRVRRADLGLPGRGAGTRCPRIP